MTTLKVIHEKASKKENVCIKSGDDVFKLMNFLKEEARENFYILHLDAKNNVLSKELISVGSLTSSIIHPREVFKGALLNNSAFIICVHNHPSGDPTPSSEDIQITRRLLEVSELVGIKVLDHIIIGRNNYYSFEHSGDKLTSAIKNESSIKEKDSEKIISDNDRESIEELLSDPIINIESVAELIDQINDGTAIIEIKGDALDAVVAALRSSINGLKKEIYVLDRTYRLTVIDYKYDPSEEKPYICKDCGKAYSRIDFMPLEDRWGDFPCNACGSREYTVIARDGIRTIDIGRQVA